MELRQVRSFLAVAAEGSITAAAKKIRLTQPALSRQIKSLEEELGVALLERGAHSVSLTEAGETLAKDGSKWVAMAEQIETRVRAAGAGETLRLAYAPSLAGELLGVALERLAQTHPRVRVRLFDRSTAEMKAGLAAGDFDLIVTVPDESDPGIRWERVLQRGWQLAVAAGHRLAGSGKISPEELADERWLMFGQDEYPDYWSRVTTFCKERGLRPKVAGEFDGVSSLAMAVESGMGVALVAAGSRVGGGRVEMLELDPAPEPICVAAGLAAGQEAGLPCRVLIEEMRRAAG